MALKVEEYLPIVRYNGFNTDKDVNLGGTTTLTGATNISGAAAFTSTVYGVKPYVANDVSAATVAVTAAQSGGIFIATKGSATQTYTLPAVAAGLIYTFIAGDAAGELLVNPTGSVVMELKASEGGATIATVAGTGIKNTAATNVKGDSITLVCDGAKWWTSNQSGTWASQ